MSHPLEGWLPNDARWSTLPIDDLRKQCAARNLPDTGPRASLLQQLLTYRQAHPNIKRHHRWQDEPPSYRETASTAETTRFELARVVDKPLRKEGCFQRNFRICDGRVWKRHVTVSIGTVLKCSCYSLFNQPCEHQIYVLRDVLNCPEPYCWQKALLPSELQAIYQNSHAIRFFGPEGIPYISPEMPGHEDELCVCCFRPIRFNRLYPFGVTTGCKKCKKPIHQSCSDNVKEVRTPKKRDVCWICYEDGNWTIEKFGCPGGARDMPDSAPHGAALAVHTQVGPPLDVVGDSIEREGLDADEPQGSNSSKDEDSEEEDPSNNQRTNEPGQLLSSSPLSSPKASLSPVDQEVPSSPIRRQQPPRESKTNWKAFRLIGEEQGALANFVSSNNAPLSLPGNPALIWKAMQEERGREQQQGTKEKKQLAVPKPSSQAHSLPTTTPDEAERREDIIVFRNNLTSDPVEQHSCANTSTTSTETLAITATEPDASTADDHQTSDTPAEEPTTVPSTAVQSHLVDPTSADTQASSPNPLQGKVEVNNTIEAVELAQKCILLAKESVQARKKSEHEAEKMKKRHKRELKKIKKRNKQEVKRLEKKIEGLEKEVLKILGGPRVAAKDNGINNIIIKVKDRGIDIFTKFLSAAYYTRKRRSNIGIILIDISRRWS
ncbi:hypothetical protein B0T20DRAFT_393162 [Sordaria brevicollis]|uniref:SWIM-type domain-containing protein n=1 Tax=Sordaria brevicollis TaxID=83679 RepID=A0AAE0PF66_SORBR|nr:hypothetical protein B0T20DRAFT_393162 [Sordaria brevicollis]